MTSVPCACRDCFDAATSNDDDTPALCWACQDAGCEPAPVPYPDYPTPAESVAYECQREDAYQS